MAPTSRDLSSRIVLVELDMDTAEGTQPFGIVTISRAVVAAAAGVVANVERVVVGDANVRTAQGNAWAAIEEDRARARARADMNEMVAAILADGPRRTDTRESSLV
jgi:hypothetical protein